MTDALVAHDRLTQVAIPLRLQSPAPKTGLSFRHILLPLDGSPSAERMVRYLIAVARANSPRVTLLKALEPPQLVGTRGIDPVEWEMLRADAQAYLSGMVDRLRHNGIEAGIALVQGTAAEQIVSYARQQAVDLVIMSSHGAGSTSGSGAGTHDMAWPLGSTAQKVIATTPTSLLIVPSEGSAPVADEPELHLRRMLLPLDCSARAECILPAAIALARSHDAELVLAHVVPEPEMPRRMGPSREDLELAHRVVERNRREAVRYLRETSNRLAVDYNRIEVRLCVASKRAQTLRELAEREGVDLIILAAHGSTGDTHQRYGGVAAKFLQEGYGPVIILQDLAGLAARDAQIATAQHGHRPDA
jgi:nucleotide-binding universal stress UspA family protein